MFEELFQSTSKKDKFREACNYLLIHTFVLRKRDDCKKHYFFIKQNLELFKQYFDLIGYELIVNEDQGVLVLFNTFKQGKLELNKYDSILLLILRLIYIEKRKELSVFNDDVVVLMEEINQKYEMLKIKSKPKLDKGMKRKFVGLFKKYNIINNLDSDVTNDEARIVIHPSINMAISLDDINEYYQRNVTRLKAYSGNLKEGDLDE